MNPTNKGMLKAQIEVLIRSAHIVGAELMRGTKTYPESEAALAKLVDETYKLFSAHEPKYEQEVV